MTAPPMPAKFVLFLVLYPPLIGSLLSGLFWAWGALQRRPLREPLLLEASSVAAFLVGGALCFALWGERYVLVHLSLPPLPLLSFRLDAAVAVVCLGAGVTALLGMALGERGTLPASARLGLLSLTGFCSTLTNLPLLTLCLLIATVLAFFSSLGRWEMDRELALRLFLLAVGLALVGAGLRLPVAWCEEGDILALSDLTGYMPLRLVYRAVGALSLGFPLAFLLPMGEGRMWATALLAQAVGAVLARLFSISLPTGAGGSWGLPPFLALGAFLGGLALLSLAGKGAPLGALARGAFLLGLLPLLHGKPEAVSAGLLVLATSGPASSTPVGEGWKGWAHRMALAFLPPFATSSALWLAVSSLWKFGHSLWIISLGLAWVCGATGALLAKPSRGNRGYLLLPLLLVVAFPLPLLAIGPAAEALATKI